MCLSQLVVTFVVPDISLGQCLHLALKVPSKLSGST